MQCAFKPFVVLLGNSRNIYMYLHIQKDKQIKYSPASFNSGSSNVTKHQSKQIHFVCFLQQYPSVTAFPTSISFLCFFLLSRNEDCFYFEKINTILESMWCLERKIKRKQIFHFQRSPVLWDGSESSPAVCLHKPDSDSAR